MPELPEVETIKIGLEKYLIGHKIESIEVLFSKIIQQGKVEDIVGAVFEKARRLGKVLILDLSNGLSMVVHVKMTGQLIYSNSYRPHKHTHVIFHLKGGSKLFYNDIRKFGWIKIVPTSQVLEMKFLKELGPEPLFGLTKEKFINILENKSIAIKVLLMDQKRIGGIGNIYANDALFLAGIHPGRKANTLLNYKRSLEPDESEVTKLFKALETVIADGIKYGGSSEITYLNALGEKGSYQNHSPIYGKKGKPCPKCKNLIQMVRLGGRSTFLCPACQV